MSMEKYAMMLELTCRCNRQAGFQLFLDRKKGTLKLTCRHCEYVGLELSF